MILDNSFADAILDILSSADYKFDIKMFDDFLTPTLVPQKARWIYIKKQNTFMKLPDIDGNDVNLIIYIMNNEIITLIKNAIQRIRACAGQYGVIVDIKVLSNKNRRKNFSNIIGKYIEQKKMNESTNKKVKVFSQYTLTDFLQLVKESNDKPEIMYYRNFNYIYGIKKKIYIEDRPNSNIEFVLHIDNKNSDFSKPWYVTRLDELDCLVQINNKNKSVWAERIDNYQIGTYPELDKLILQLYDAFISEYKKDTEIIEESYKPSEFRVNDKDALRSAKTQYRKTDNRKEKLTLLSLHKLRRIRESRKYELLKKYQMMKVIYASPDEGGDEAPGF